MFTHLWCKCFFPGWQKCWAKLSACYDANFVTTPWELAVFWIHSFCQARPVNNCCTAIFSIDNNFFRSSDTKLSKISQNFFFAWNRSHQSKSCVHNLCVCRNAWNRPHLSTLLVIWWDWLCAEMVKKGRRFSERLIVRKSFMVKRNFEFSLRP